MRSFQPTIVRNDVLLSLDGLVFMDTCFCYILRIIFTGACRPAG